MPSPLSLPYPTDLWLVRHAESGGNVADRQAHDSGALQLTLSHRDPDMPLSDQGVEQARALGRSWSELPADRRPSTVLTSPYARAEQTAREACRAAGWQVAIERDERVRERELGVLDGWTKAGIEEHFPEEASRRAWLGKFYYRPPGGESWADVAGRVRQVMTSLRLDHGQDQVAVFTHQAVIMLFRYVLEDLTEAEILDIDAGAVLANTAVTIYRRQDAKLGLVSYNDTTHLEREATTEVTHEPDVHAAGA